MILVTGATGTVGSALVRRLVATGHPVRCLVRDPRRLGLNRVRVHIARGELTDPASFRNALRGVSAVVHMAASIRDQPEASMEELNALATLRLARTAERSGTERFIFFSAIGAELHASTRFMRSKALAEEALSEVGMERATLAPSIVYAPGDPWLRLLERLSYLPVMPLAGAGEAVFQPIFAEDVADCAVSVLEAPELPRAVDGSSRFELAGPQELSYRAIVGLVLSSLGRRRRRVPVPMPLARSGLQLLERAAGPSVFATREEVELLEVPMTTPRGTADAERLGVHPHHMAEVLGLA